MAENLRQLLKTLQKEIKSGVVDKTMYTDILTVINLLGQKDVAYADKQAVKIYESINKINTSKKLLLYRAPRDFDSYLRYIEWNRDINKKFYQPRRKALRPVVDAMQALADDKLDLLTISLPPGVGKTTLALFFLCWLGGRNPEKPVLGVSYSNSLISGAYAECLRIMAPDGEYLWNDVFPDSPIVDTNAKDLLIDLGQKRRFKSLEFTSIGAGNAGRVRAEQLLYCDDLVDGIETAMNIEQLNKLYGKYQTDLLQRKIGTNPKELHIATRWSVHDVIGRLQNQHENDPRAKFIVVPALDENDKSNFDYKNAPGFSTAFYHKQRDSMDDLSWKALYMNEPIEREGLLYDINELQRYYELPTATPDAVIAVVDTKDRGDDYCVMVIAYQYGEKYYIEDCVMNNLTPDIYEPEIVDKLIKHKVNLCRFESNSAGGVIADNVQEKMKARGGKTHITKAYTTGTKETKIIVESSYVKEYFYFKDTSAYTQRSEYGIMMRFLCGYTLTGKNKHDDVPDTMAMLARFTKVLYMTTCDVVKRPF